MDSFLMQCAGTRLVWRARCALAREDGFTLVEMLVASVIMITLATGIAGVLTSSIAAHTVARERTNAEQCAADQVEKIRQMAYDQVGVVLGNPPGTVAPTTACGNASGATAAVAISYEDDPTPTSYATLANYKKVTVTVTRDRDGKQLARLVTYVSPSSRAPYGGINNAIINATVIDLGTNIAYPGATVNLSNGPSANRSDTTDASGTVSFVALTPNPTSGAQAYYDLTVSGLPTGYQTFAADVPPGTATPPTTASHIQLAPSQTSATSIRVFKAASINVVLLDSGGNPYTAGATLKISSSFTGATTSDSVASGASTKTITSLGGQPVIPGATYTIHGYTSTGLCADPAPSPVPASGYPGNTAQTFTLTLVSCPMGNLAVNAQQLGTNAPCVPVTLANGPNDISLTATTDSAGNVSFSNIPAGSGYTIVTGAKFGQTGSTTATVTASSTTSKTVTLADPTTATLVVTTTSAGLSVGAGVPVTLTGGSCGIAPQTVNTDSLGKATFTNVPTGTGFPSGTGYTAAVTNYIGMISGSVAVASIASGTNNAALVLPTGTVNVTVTWAGQPAGTSPSAGAVTITGGPFGGTYTGSTNASGVASVTVPPTSPAYPYTVTASKNGSAVVTGTAVTPSTLAAGGTATSTVALTPTKTFTITIQRGGAAAASTAVNISITGGPNGTAGATPAYTFSLTTNASGVLPTVTVPLGTSGATYTIKANLTTCGASGSNRSGQLTGQSNTGANTNVTVNMTSSTCPFSPLP